jgi:hypothetical protein
MKTVSIPQMKSNTPDGEKKVLKKSKPQMKSLLLQTKREDTLHRWDKIIITSIKKPPIGAKKPYRRPSYR